MSDFLGIENEMGQHGYMFEPEKNDSESENSDSCTDTSDEEMNEKNTVEANWREGRSKMAVSVWCRCGHCRSRKSDEECFCCKEHELALDIMDSTQIQCLTEKNDLESYVAHRPSLEMLFVDCLIRRFVRGPAPEQLSNR